MTAIRTIVVRLRKRGRSRLSSSGGSLRAGGGVGRGGGGGDGRGGGACRGGGGGPGLGGGGGTPAGGRCRNCSVGTASGGRCRERSASVGASGWVGRGIRRVAGSPGGGGGGGGATLSRQPGCPGRCGGVVTRAILPHRHDLAGRCRIHVRRRRLESPSRNSSSEAVSGVFPGSIATVADVLSPLTGSEECR
jgi:hypothetical protein